jgi:hypothetical protein
MKSGMGMDGFIWFHGVVEDRMDPLGLGRMRVRAFGWDDKNRVLVPTEHLPWAYPMLPLNSDQGQVHTPKEGTWVVGFFRDCTQAQDRIVLGTINTGAFTIPPDSPPLTSNISHLSKFAGDLGKAIKSAESLGVKKVSEQSEFGGLTRKHSSAAHAEDRAIDVGTGGSHRDYGQGLEPQQIQAPIIAFIEDWAKERQVTVRLIHAGSGGKDGREHQNHIHVSIVNGPVQIASSSSV